MLPHVGLWLTYSLLDTKIFSCSRILINVIKSSIMNQQSWTSEVWEIKIQSLHLPTSSFISFKSGNKLDWEPQEVTYCKSTNPLTKSEPYVTFMTKVNIWHYSINTMLYRLADRLLLLKCYDNKMVKLYSSIGASSCSWPTKKKKTFGTIEPIN